MTTLRFLALAAFAVSPLPAAAYIDPNAGGLIWQIASPIFIAIAFGWGYLKARFLVLYRKLSGKDPSPEQ